ncbi:50S ribosomal protein L13 [Methylosinus sp. Sm6]|nr:50S ribosomal protein L13 [Methylosinus sp. Sm6]
MALEQIALSSFVEAVEPRSWQAKAAAGRPGLSRSTHFSTRSETQKKWIVIDADGLVVGRLASIIALRLRGKHKATFTPHMDDGDNVVVVNAEKVALTGRKRDEKRYRRHTGFPGGLQERSARFVLEGRFPERVLEKAVERMLPRGPLGRAQFGNLRVYKGPNHPHAAQKPILLDVAALNPKNKKTAGRRDDMARERTNDFMEALEAMMRRLTDELATSQNRLEKRLDEIKQKQDSADQTMSALTRSFDDFYKRAVAEYDSNQQFHKETRSYQNRTDEELRSIAENTRRTADILEKLSSELKNLRG